MNVSLSLLVCSLNRHLPSDILSEKGLVISFSKINEALASKDGNGYMLMPPNDFDSMTTRK